jgi:cell division protein FtsL
LFFTRGADQPEKKKVARQTEVSSVEVEQRAQIAVFSLAVAVVSMTTAVTQSHAHWQIHTLAHKTQNIKEKISYKTLSFKPTALAFLPASFFFLP